VNTAPRRADHSPRSGVPESVSAPIKTPASKEVYVSASLEAGLYTQTLDQNCVTPETIELILSTRNAASFDYVASNVPVGTHMISLQARITSTTSVDTGAATAEAEALVGKGTLVGQIVRAAN
jgi:hypothetical protein